jgi:hypothetical protein
VFSYAVWSNGVDTYLPRAQKVVFLDEGKECAIVTWEQVERVVGHLLEPVEDLYPPRWRVREFPTSQQLEQLRDPAS